MAFQRKMGFNPDPNKQAQEVQTLDFQEHLKNKLSKISKTIGLLTKLQKILTRPPLLTTYLLDPILITRPQNSKLCYFYKVFNKQSSTYLLNVIPV